VRSVRPGRAQIGLKFRRRVPKSRCDQQGFALAFRDFFPAAEKHRIPVSSC
jgi:hypothetical protein